MIVRKLPLVLAQMDGLPACLIPQNLLGVSGMLYGGTYSVDSTHVYLHVDRFNEDNLIYTSLPFEIADSILFTPSGDGLRIYFKDGQQKEEAFLSAQKSITSFTTAGNKDDSVTVKVIFLLMFFVPIVLVGLVVRLIARLIKRSRNL